MQNDRGTEDDGERTSCASDLGPWSWKGCDTIVVESSGEPAVDLLRSVLSLLRENGSGMHLVPRYSFSYSQLR